MLEKFHGRTILPFNEYLRLQILEGSDEKSKWFAGERLKHPPSDGEAVLDYEENGGAQKFYERYISENKLPRWFLLLRKIVKFFSELRFKIKQNPLIN